MKKEKLKSIPLYPPLIKGEQKIPLCMGGTKNSPFCKGGIKGGLKRRTPFLSLECGKGEEIVAAIFRLRHLSADYPAERDPPPKAGESLQLQRLKSIQLLV
jgi:hypothetical protein